METFHLYHLAACWKGRTLATKAGSTPLTTGPVNPTISQTTSSPIHLVHPAPLTSPNSVIRAAATHLVFASRKSRDFITPQQVAEVEKWTGQVRFSPRCPHPSRLGLTIFGFLQAVLNALVNLAIPQDVSISSLDPRLLMTFSSEYTQSATLFGKSCRNLIGASPNQISISVTHLCLLKSQCFLGFCPFNHSLEHDRVLKVTVFDA